MDINDKYDIIFQASNKDSYLRFKLLVNFINHITSEGENPNPYLDDDYNKILIHYKGLTPMCKIYFNAMLTDYLEILEDIEDYENCIIINNLITLIHNHFKFSENL